MSEEANKPGATPDRPALAQREPKRERELPRAVVVALALLAPIVVVAVVLWGTRSEATSSGAIEHVGVVEQQGGERVLVPVHVSIENRGPRPLRLWNFTARLRTPDGEWTDEASSAVDHERYFNAYPELRQHAIEPFLPEATVETGGRRRGLLIFGFPMSSGAFARRESLTVTVDIYDRPPLVLRETIAPGVAVP